MERTLLSPIAQEAPQQLASVRVRPAEYSGRVSSGCKRRSSTDFADSSDSSLAQKQLRKHQSLLAQEVQACSHAQLSCAVSLEIGDCTQINTSFREVSCQYITGAVLGAGGSATVYSAIHVKSGRHVAIKVFTDTSMAAREAAATEYLCAERVAGPHSIAHYGVGFMNGHPAIIVQSAARSLQEYINGYDKAPSQQGKGAGSDGTLSPWFSSSTTGSEDMLTAGRTCSGRSSRSSGGGHDRLPSVFQIVDLITPVLKGAKAMHDAGLTHCDLKPSNVLVTDDGSIKLADFGTACDIDPCTGILVVNALNERSSGNAVDHSSCLSEEPRSPCTPARSDMTGSAAPALSAECPAERDDPSWPANESYCDSDDDAPTALNLTLSLMHHLPACVESQDREASLRSLTANFEQQDATMADLNDPNSRVRSSSARNVTMFTCLYSCPERSNTADQRKVDVWAIGCILYELCTGKHLLEPKSGQNVFGLMCELYSPDWVPPRLPGCMKQLQPLLDAMLCRDPAKRPTPAELLKFDILRTAFDREESVRSECLREPATLEHSDLACVLTRGPETQQVAQAPQQHSPRSQWSAFDDAVPCPDTPGAEQGTPRLTGASTWCS